MAFRFRGFRRGSGFRALSLWFLAVCVVIFVIEILNPNVIDFLGLVPKAILKMPWMLVTAVFLHWDFSHLFYNMFALAIFGLALERIIGSKNFAVLFFVAGIIANIAGALAYPEAISLGASGAIMGIVGALAALRPRLIVWFGGPMPLILLAGIWILIDLLGFISPVQTGIGNAAHLAGVAVGIVFGLFWRKKFAPARIIRRRVDSEFFSDEEVYGGYLMQ